MFYPPVFVGNPFLAAATDPPPKVDCGKCGATVYLRLGEATYPVRAPDELGTSHRREVCHNCHVDYLWATSHGEKWVFSKEKKK